MRWELLENASVRAMLALFASQRVKSTAALLAIGRMMGAMCSARASVLTALADYEKRVASDVRLRCFPAGSISGRAAGRRPEAARRGVWNAGAPARSRQRSCRKGI